jgi:hypothetical protein
MVRLELPIMCRHCRDVPIPPAGGGLLDPRERRRFRRSRHQAIGFAERMLGNTGAR